MEEGTILIKAIDLITMYPILSLVVLIILLSLFFIKTISKLFDKIISLIEQIKDFVLFFRKEKTFSRSYLPNKPEYFIGRKDKLNELNNLLKTTNSVILVNGLGGIGKTTIALEYIHNKKYYKKYKNIEWVSITDDIHNSFIIHKFSDTVNFKFDIDKQPNDNFKILMAELNKITGNNLLVIDNANDEKDIINNLDELKRSNWKLLFVSRCNVQEIPAKIEIGVLEPEEAKKLFLKYCPNIKDLTILDTLLQDLHYHTLLIELLAKTLTSNNALDLNKLFEKFKKDGIKSQDFQIQLNIGNHAVMTNKAKQARINEYIHSIFDISTLNDNEKKYLLYFSILPSIDLYFEKLKNFFGIQIENEIGFIESLNHLFANGWIQENNKNYKMHHLIQTVIREKLKPDAENCNEIIKTFIKLLEYNTYINPLSKKEFVPFVESIWNSVYDELNEQQILNSNLASLADANANILSSLGNNKKAFIYQKKSITIGERILDPVHPDLATFYNNYGLKYQNLGNYDKALYYQMKSLEILENILEPDNLVLATSYNNMGVLYLYLNNNEMALEYQIKSIAIGEKILDPEHPDLATSYNNIGMIYNNLCDYEKALEFQKKSIVIIEKVLDPYHPSLASSYNNIGLIYQELGDFTKSLNYFKKTIEIEEKVLEPLHPTLALSYNNIATVYQDLHDYEKALEFQMKSIAIREKILDSEHQDLATSYSHIAMTYQDLNDYEKAIEFQMKSITILEKLLDSEDPDLAISYSNISSIYQDLGDYKKALEFQKKSIIIREKVLGPENIILPFFYNNIAVLFYYLLDYSNAQKFNDRAINIFNKKFSKDHPQLLSCFDLQKAINEALGMHL